MRQTVEELSLENSKFGGKLDGLKAKNRAYKEELIKTRTYLEEIQKQVHAEQEAHAATRKELHASADSYRALKRDFALQTNALQTLETKYNNLLPKHERLVKAHDELATKLQEYESDATLQQGLQRLKLHEFVTMAHSNLKVAGAIEDLMEKMKKEQQEKREREEERRRRELEQAREEEYRHERDLTDADYHYDRERDRDRDRPRRSSRSPHHPLAHTHASSSVDDSSFDSSSNSVSPAVVTFAHTTSVHNIPPVPQPTTATTTAAASASSASTSTSNSSSSSTSALLAAQTAQALAARDAAAQAAAQAAQAAGYDHEAAIAAAELSLDGQDGEAELHLSDHSRPATTGDQRYEESSFGI